MMLAITQAFAAPAAQKTPVSPAAKPRSTAVKPAANTASAFYKSGASFQKAKIYAAAIADYEKAVKLAPDMWQAWLGMGLCYYAQGQMQNARLALTKVLTIKPAEPTAKKYYDLAEPDKNVQHKKETEKPKTKGDMAWRSALLPGSGQFYNNEKVKGYIYSIGFLASVGGIIKFTLDEQSAVSKYENTNYNFDDYYKKAETAQYMVYIPIGTAAIFWTLSVVDCFLTGADETTDGPPGAPMPQVFLEPGGGVTVAMDIYRADF